MGENAAEYIDSLARIDKTNLAYDETGDSNLRYIGANPNNYVKFNDELWRIIGVMHNVPDSDDDESEKLKIIRAEPLMEYAWNSGDGYGNTNWNHSDLRSMLNDEYLNKEIRATMSFESNGLNNLARSMIVEIKWELGKIDTNNAVTSFFYQAERGKIQSFGELTISTNYVGLMYPSDYGYAVGGAGTYIECTQSVLANFSKTICYTNNWLYLSGVDQWTLSPKYDSLYSVFTVDHSGKLSLADVHTHNIVRPVVYLDSSVLITGGSGTSTDPYLIAK